VQAMILKDLSSEVCMTYVGVSAMAIDSRSIGEIDTDVMEHCGLLDEADRRLQMCYLTSYEQSLLSYGAAMLQEEFVCL